MKNILFVFCFLYTLSTYAGESISTAIVQLGQEEIKDTPLEKWGVGEFDKGYFKTIVFLKDCKKEKKYEIEIYRPYYDASIVKYDFIQDTEGHLFVGEKGAQRENMRFQPFVQVLSAKGFLPGENVELVFKRLGREVHRQAVIPNPIIAKSKESDLTVKAELCRTVHTMYLIIIDNIAKGEVLTFESQSGEEYMKSDLPIDGMPKLGFCYHPGIVTARGGESQVTFTTKSGEKISLFFPWGDELKDYLGGKKY